MRKRLLCLTGLVLPVIALPQADEPSRAQPPRLIRASADAVVDAKPDHAEVRLGVVTQAPTAEAAATQNASQTTRVIDSLKTTLGKAGEIKTSDYSIAPQYQYGNNMPPKLTGYRASNTVLVEIDDLAVVGSAIDASVKAGANDVSGILFSLKNDEPIRQQAISEAATKARMNAEAIARALGVQVVGVWQAETTSSQMPPIRPMPMAARSMAAAETSTPVEAGTLQVRANVTVTLQIR